ncbi:MAG: hypothetical protein AAFR51_09955 [Pseudomonadota bacterium]
MYRTIILSAWVSTAILSAAADPVLEMMRSASADGPVYAYEMTYSGEDVVASGKVDPSQPEGQRIQLYSPSEDELSGDFKKGLKQMDAEADGDIWCTEFAQMVPTNAVQTGQDESSVTYAFTPQPGDDADKTRRKMMKQLNGTVTLAKSDGAVLAYNMVLPKPYKPAMVAKIERFEMSAACNRAPDGRTYVEQFEFDISGSAMMQTFEETVTRQITKLLDPVG